MVVLLQNLTVTYVVVWSVMSCVAYAVGVDETSVMAVGSNI